MARTALCLTTGFLALTTAAAQAADLAPVRAPALPLPDIEYRITPFFWGSGLSGTVGTRRNLPTVDVDMRFRDILRNLDFAAMIAGEYRNGRWGVLADLAYVAVTFDRARDLAVNTPGYSSASLTSKSLNATLTGFYRVYDNGTFTADLLAGGRLWYVSSEVDLVLASILPVSASTERTWADPVAGMRMHVDLGHGFGLSAYGDIGAGASRLTWQLRGTLDYNFNKQWSASVGYRHLAVDYRQGGFVYDTSLSGPIMGVSYRF